MTIQKATLIVRTGAQADLTGLSTGEFGLAEDTNRLYIGSLPQRIVANGNTATFAIDPVYIQYGSKVYVTVDNAPEIVTTNWLPTGGTVVLPFVPNVNSIVEIRVNHELQFKGSGAFGMQSIPLAANVPTAQPTGITMIESATDTGIIEYSIAGAGFKQVGTFYCISGNGGIEYAANSLRIGGESPVELTASISNGVISIDFTNTSSSPATLYYSNKTWKTV